MQIRQADKHMQTSLRGIAKRAKEVPKYRFGNLYSLLNEGNLRWCYGQLNRKSAPGVDGVDWEEFGIDLDGNVSQITEALKEYLGPEPFNSKRLREGFSSTPDIRLLKLFNESKSSNSPIEKFLGFFKIIENFCPQKSRQPIKDAILSNRTIQEQFNCIDGVQISFDEFVEKIVKIRHESSHLKLYKNFGLTSIDQRVQSEVIPLSEILEILVYKIIKNV